MPIALVHAEETTQKLSKMKCYIILTLEKFYNTRYLMEQTPIKRWFTALLVGLFLCVQGISSAHATSVDGQSHEHDCILCTVSANQGDVQVVLPTPPAIYFSIDLQPFSPIATFTSALYSRPLARAPPPRGPPTLIQ